MFRHLMRKMQTLGISQVQKHTNLANFGKDLKNHLKPKEIFLFLVPQFQVSQKYLSASEQIEHRV